MGQLYDVAVVGGGIVGLATAKALQERGTRSVIVIESEPRLAAHQTDHNSGVIHAGLYYAPGSLKARLCVEGREALYRFCEERGVPFRRCGKLLVAGNSEEAAALEALAARGRANGLRGLRTVAGHEVRDIEPATSGVGGLWVPETGVVRFAQVAEALAQVVRERGGTIITGTRFLGAVARETGVTVETTAGEVRARYLVGCAGLQADRVARACGVSPDVAIVPFRGEYWEVQPPRAAAIRHLIYPVPDPALPFLGVHLTRTIDDRVEAGPNALLALSRHGYSRWRVSPRDLAAMAGFPGFWRMTARHWRMGTREIGRARGRATFATALQRLVPAITAGDLRRAGAGVRAQAIDRAGRLIDDFAFASGPRSLHVLNAPSPAATASIAIGAAIAAQVPD